MRKSVCKDSEYRKYLDMPEQQNEAAERFKKFCERATAKNKEWDDFGGTDTYKLVQLLSPEFDDKKKKTAIDTYNRKDPPLDREGQIWHLTVALKKLFIASLYCETPECDDGGMPASGDNFRTRFLNTRLDRKINELKELMESTSEDGIGKKLDESLTENAKLRMKIDQLEQDCDALDQECSRLGRLCEDKDTKINYMVPKHHAEMLETENKQLNKLIEKLGHK